MPSACRDSSPVAKSVRMKRARTGSSAASSAKRSSASGSRSSAMSMPSGPSRSAMSPACPPPPKVQSTAMSPGRGSSRARASSASTGTCVAVMSSRLTKLSGDVDDLVGERVVVGAPRVAVPDLQAVLGPGDGDLLAEARVLEELGRDHHAARAVELAREGVGGEVRAQLARLGRERVETLERPAHVALVVGGRPQLDAPLDALGDDDAVGEGGAEAGRDGEPVLCIERVVEGAAEGHVGRAGVEGWEEPLHPGSMPALYPTLLHMATLLAHDLPPQTTFVVLEAPISPCWRALRAVGEGGRRGVSCARRAARERAATWRARLVVVP